MKVSSGMGKPSKLGSKVADSKGTAKWTWKVGAKTAMGTWPVTVNCSSKGAQGKLETSLVVGK